MTTCSRKWQVEAVRDGRLRGKDRESAERHRNTCAECAQEARELAALGEGIAQLPSLTRDPISVHRTRQRLLSAFNEAVLEPRVRRVPVWLAFAGVGVAALAGAVWMARPRTATPSALNAVAASFVEVKGDAEAHWTERRDLELDRIEFFAGFAAFKVRPHPGRRVIISLPDGELEDLGTTFTVLVRDGATQHVAVTEGRVSLRLRGRAEAVISAGAAWDAGVDAPPTQPVASAVVVAPSQVTHTRQNGVAQGSVKPAALNTAARVASTPSASASADTNKPDTASAAAEDASYLRIVALLKAGKQDAARAEAKQYLLRFPNGFRRVEVLNIVSR